MNSVEHISPPIEPAPSVNEILELPTAPFIEYWHQFAELGNGRANVVAERNSDKISALTDRLYQPRRLTENSDVDRLSDDDVPKEWYLGLGTMNKLSGSRATMELAAAKLWTNKDKADLSADEVAVRFREELSGMQDGKIPEQLRFAIHDETAIKRMGLAGQIMLDVARIPANNPAEEIGATQNAYRINSVLVKKLSEQEELTIAQRGVLSDGLKAKYDSGFAILAARHRNGLMDDDKYGEAYTAVLADEVRETGKIADKLTNGELYEHYYLALMRYSLNAWQGQLRFDVQSASRRQDEPHDQFNTSGLPNYAFDAQIVDTTLELPTQIVQLKSYRKSDLQVYAEGVTIVDDVFEDNDSNWEKREEMIAGMHQMHGLINELRTGQMYEGEDSVIRRHVGTILEGKVGK
jgi:hypothetical protein